MKNSTVIDGITLYFDDQDHDASMIFEKAITDSAGVIKETWDLNVPRDCRVYVMRTWWGFIYGSAPWPWRILLLLTLPFWILKVVKFWKISGGWAQRFGRRHVVGVKPPMLIKAADTRLGEKIFIKENNIDNKVRNITCHELTHAFTAHLKLPMWLNEGLAMITVDKLLQKPSVKADYHGMLR